MLKKLLEDKERIKKDLEMVDEKIFLAHKENHEEISKEVALWLKREHNFDTELSIFANRTYGDVNNYYDMEILFQKKKLLLSFEITKHGFENYLNNDITHCYKLIEYDEERDSLIYHSVYMKFKNRKCIKLYSETFNTRKLLFVIEKFVNLLPNILSYIDRRRYLYFNYNVKELKKTIYMLLYFYKSLPFPKDITLKILKLVLF